MFHVTPINLSLNGHYQSENYKGYTIDVSIDKQKNTFEQYINGRNVNQGKLEYIDKQCYKLTGDNKVYEIYLSNDNSFEIILNKINNKPITLKFISDNQLSHETEFDDIDEYKKLLE